MSLSPALLTTLLRDGFRVPIVAGTTFQAGDVVPIGQSLVCIAANDYNWQGSTSSPSAGNLVGQFTFPKGSTEAIAAGIKVGWNSTAQTATAVASTANYPLGISIAAATTAGTTVDVLVWPGAGQNS